LPYFVPFFLLGVILALWHWKQPGWLMLLAWIIGTALGNSLIEQNVFSARYIPVLPALTLLTAVGLYSALSFIWQLSGKNQTVIRVTLEVTVLLALVQMVYYFGFHLPAYNRQIRQYNDFGDIPFRSVAFPPDTRVHVFPDHPNAFSDWQMEVMFRYLGSDMKWDMVVTDELTDAYLKRLLRKVDNAFFVRAGDSETAERIRQYFTAGPPQPSPHNIPLDRQYYLIYAPAAEQS
jgi:hypothetical protein